MAVARRGQGPGPRWWTLIYAAIVLLGLPVGLHAASSNDNWANAITLSLNTTYSTVSTVGNTKEVGEPAASAGTGGCSAWWKWTATSNAPVAVSTKASNYDTVLDVWTGSSVSTLSRVTFNDDYAYGDAVPGSGGIPRTSMCVFTPVTGTTYYFRVDGWASGGSGTAEVSLQPVPTLSIATTTAAYEGATNGVWTLSLSNGLVDTIPISWGVTGGTASSSHYTLTPSSSPLLLSSMATSTTISAAVSDDGIATGNLTIITGLYTAGYGNYLIGTSSAVMQIVDAESPEIYVNASATGANTGATWANAYTDLHTALANAASGNQIWVAQGTYTTTSASDTFQLVSGSSLYGGFAGTETTLGQRDRFSHPVLLSGTYATNQHSAHVVTGASNTLISGFTIQGGAASDYGGGMYGLGAGITVDRCLFSGNTAVFGGGGLFLDTNGATTGDSVTQCYFTANTYSSTSTDFGGGGAFIFSPSAPTAITNCVFASNAGPASASISTSGGGALNLYFAPNTQITNCTFYGNSAPAACLGGAILNDSSTSLGITNCIFNANLQGGSISSVAQTNWGGTTPSTTVTSDLFDDATITAGLTSGGGNFVNSSAGFTNTSSLAGADGIFGTADDGLSLASGSIAIDSGTSAGAPTIDISNHGRPLGAGVDMGAYERTAVIYVTTSGSSAASGLSWATATTLPHALAIALNGNQIWVAQGTYSPASTSSPTSTFAMVYGVDLYGGFAGTETSLSQRNVALHHTILSGAPSSSYHVVTGASDATLDGFIITGGLGNGGALPDAGGGGLLCNGTSPTIQGCVFTGNSASQDGGAVYIHSAAPVFRNCVFAGNTAAYFGGAVEAEYSSTPTFINCTFASNSSQYGGAIELYSSANPTLLNCILWDDSSPELYNNGGTPVFTACDIAGGVPSGSTDGGGNLNADPQFLNVASPAGSDGVLMTADDGLMVGGTSPCLDVGSAAGATVDVLRASRPQGAGYDIGAYETPSLTVVATSASAIKPAFSGTPTNGLFTITRSGLQAQALTVYLQAGGTAVPGGDYVAIPSTVVIPAGASSVTVPVSVIASSQAQNPVTVTLQVLPGVSGDLNAYAVATATATVTITNLNVAGVIITPIGPFTSPTTSNVLYTNQPPTTATFQVQLNSQPTQSVTVNLASGNTSEGTINASSLTFTATNWNTPQTVTVSAVADYIAHGPQSYDILSNGAVSQDPFYSRSTTIVLAAQQSSFATTIPYVAQSGNNWQVKVDGVARSTSSFTVSNNGGGATITLAAPLPGAGDSVQIQYLGEQSFTGTGTATNFDTSFPAVLAHAKSWVVSVNGIVQPTNTYSIVANAVNNGQVDFAAAPANGATILVQTDVVAAENDNTHVKGVQVTPGAVSVTEGGVTANYTIRLTSQPSSGNVTVSLMGLNVPFPSAANITTNVPSVTFTPTYNQAVSGTTGGWNVPQTITVSAARDYNIEAPGGGTYAAQVSQAVIAANGCDYYGLAVSPVQVTVTDVDSAAIVATPSSNIVTSESGATATFTLQLSSRPLNTVSVTFSCIDSLDSGSTINGGAFVVGGTTQPSTAVLVYSFTPSDGQAVSGTTSGWNVPQTVTLAGLRGTVGVQGNTPYTVNLTAPPSVAGSGDGNYSSLPAGILASCLNTDIDQPAVLISTGQLTVVRGDPVGQTFTIQLATDPTTGVNGHPTDIVVVGFADQLSGLVTMTPSTVVFTHSGSTAYNLPVTVRVTAPDDGVVEAPVQLDQILTTITSGNTSYSGLSPSIPVTVLDEGTAGLLITPTSGLVTPEDGGTAVFDVALRSKPAGGSSVQVTLASSNPGAGILGVQGYSQSTVADGATADITFSGAVDLTAVQPGQLVAVSGIGVNAGALTQVQAVEGQTVTVAPALQSATDAELMTFLPATAVGGATSDGSTVVTLPGTTPMGGFAEGQPVLITGLPGGVVVGSQLRYVNVGTTQLTLDDAVPAGTGVTAVIGSGSLGLSWTAAGYQEVHQVCVLGVHNHQVTGSVPYQIGISATSADPNYTTSQTVTVGSPTTTFDFPMPFVTYTGSNWAVVVDGTPTSSFTLSSNAGYAHLTLGSPAYTSVTLSYLPTVSLTALDVDSAGFTLTPLDANPIYPAPGTPSVAHYALALTSEPTSDVTVEVQSTNTAKGTVSGTPLTFTQATPNAGLGWDQPHVVTITAQGSAVADGAVSFAVQALPASSVDAIYAGLQAPTVTLATVDPNLAGIVVTPLNPPLITNPQTNTTASFSIVLTSQPLATVTIPIASSNPGKGAPTVSSVTFTPATWNIPQTVVVVGAPSLIEEGPVPYLITFGQPSTSDPAYAIQFPSPVSITGEDSNVAGYILSDPTSQTGHVFNFTVPPTDPPLTTTDLGGTAGVQFSLTSQPAADVTLTLGSSNTALGTPSPATLVFTSANWNQPQLVTITGGNANNSDTDGSYTIAATSVVSSDPFYNGFAPPAIPCSNIAQNKTPTIAPISDVNVLENQVSIAPVTITGISTGQAAEVQPLIVSVTSDNQTLLPNGNLQLTYAGGTPAPSTATLQYSPVQDQYGVAHVTVTVTDIDTSGPPPFRGGNKSASQTFAVNVGFVNQAPSFTPGSSISVLEDAPAQDFPAWATAISVGPPNESGQHASFTCVTDNPGLFSVAPAVDALTGDLTFTPAPTAFGVAHLTVTIQDDGGTANGGINSFTAAPVLITILPVNHPPTIVPGGTVTVSEGAGAQSIVGWASGITPGPPDESSQTLTISCSNDHPGLFSIQPAVDLTGTLTFTGAPTARGLANCTLTLQDNGGTANGGQDTTSVTFSIILSPTNVAPVVGMSAPASRQVPVGGSVTITASDLWATDVDATVPAPALDPNLLFTVELPPGNGTLIDDGVPMGLGSTFTQQDILNGYLTYTHDGGTSSSDGFAFTVADEPLLAGAVLASPLLPPTTLPPGVSPLTVFSMTIDRSDPVVVLTPAGPLPFLDEGPAELVAATATVSDPLQPSFQNGLVQVAFASGATDADVIGIDTTGAITLSGATVLYDGGSGPQAIGTVSTVQGASGTTMTLSGLTAAATVTSIQAFLERLTYQNIAVSPSNPITNPVTSRVLQVVVTDANADSSLPATITIAVTSLHHPPVIQPLGQLITPEGIAIDGTVSAASPDGFALTYRIVGTPTLGTASIDPVTGAFLFTPAAGVSGSGSFTIEADDGVGGITDLPVAVLVTSDAPLEPFIVSEPPMATVVGDTVIYDVIGYTPGTSNATYRVIGLDPTLYTLSPTPAGATLTLLPAATATAGYLTFAIVVTDPDNALATAQPVTLLVASAPTGGG